MSAYLVINCTVKDVALLNQYIEQAMATTGIVPLKILAMDNASETVEGTPAGARTVLVEFESKDDFRTWYNSDEYQAAIDKRLDATEGFGVLVDGV